MSGSGSGFCPFLSPCPSPEFIKHVRVRVLVWILSISSPVPGPRPDSTNTQKEFACITPAKSKMFIIGESGASCNAFKVVIEAITHSIFGP